MLLFIPNNYPVSLITIVLVLNYPDRSDILLPYHDPNNE